MNNIIIKSFKEELIKLSYETLGQYRSKYKTGFINRKLTGVLGGNLSIPKTTKQYKGSKSTGTRFTQGNLSLSSPDNKLSQ